MNQHYEFWVNYYKDLQFSDKAFSQSVKDNNDQITSHQWKPGKKEICPVDTEVILLQVSYPGLLVGLGNAHGSGQAVAVWDKDAKKEAVPPEIKLGITLDPVTGLPYLPGSTVKGILRSGFLANRNYVAALLGPDLSAAQVEELELDSFGHRHPQGEYTSNCDAGQGRDMFLDAWPVSPDGKGHLLGIENITPHRAEDIKYDGLTEPNPLTLLKVMPGVVFLFRFRIYDTTLKDGTVITAGQKRKLFRQLLLDLGAGAKTNVGFGMLTEPKNWTKPGKYCYLVQGRGVTTQQAGASVNRAQTDSGARWLQSPGEIKDDMIVLGMAKKHLIDKGWYIELVKPQGTKIIGVDGWLSKEESLDLTMGQVITVKIIKFTREKNGQYKISLSRPNTTGK